MAEQVIEFAFGSTWSDDPAGFTWTDVTSYVQLTSTNRGRSSELDLFSAGTCTLILRNDDRRFDPLNADGPYYGQLVPNVPVRVRVLHNGVYRPVFYGYVDGWKMKPGTHLGTVEVPVTDAFKILAGLSLPRSVYEAEVLADSPHAYWRLDETDGNTAADGSGNRLNGLWSGADITRGVETRFSGAGATFPGTVGECVIVPGNARLTELPITVEMFMRDPNGYPVVQGSGDDSAGFSVSIAAGGILEWACQFGADDTYYTVNSDLEQTADLSDGDLHHVVITEDVGGDVHIYVDGTERDLSSVGVAVYGTGNRIAIGGVLSRSVNYTPFDGTLSDVAVYASALSADRVAAHNAARRSPWNGDTTGQRINRVLDLIGWPEALRDIDAGEVVLGNADLNGDNVLEYLQLLAQTEQGRLFVSADGKITFHGNDRTITGTSAYTFTDDGTGTGILEDSLMFSLDDTFLFDEAIVQRKFGQPQRAVADGVTVPTRTRAIDGLLMQSDRQALALAERFVHRYGTPKTRAEAWTVRPQIDPESWPDILGLEIGDVVTLAVTPQRTGDPITLDLFVEQIVHEITPEDWTIMFQGSPVDETVYFEWDGPDGSGWGEGAWR